MDFITNVLAMEQDCMNGPQAKSVIIEIEFFIVIF